MRDAIIILALSAGIGIFAMLARVMTRAANGFETRRWRRQMMGTLRRRRQG